MLNMAAGLTRTSQIQSYLEEVWSQCFKVLDDIKETVRKEASTLARVLTNILLNNLESSEGKGEIITELLKSVIPFIMSTSGIEEEEPSIQPQFGKPSPSPHSLVAELSYQAGARGR